MSKQISMSKQIAIVTERKATRITQGLFAKRSPLGGLILSETLEGLDFGNETGAILVFPEEIEALSRFLEGLLSEGGAA